MGKKRWIWVLGTGALVGLVAVLFMTLVMALQRIFLGVPLPAELGGDRFLPLLSVNEFLGTLFRNGGPIAAKRTALLGGWAGQVGVGVLFGLVYAFVVELGRRRDPEWDPEGAGVSRIGALFVTVTVLAIWGVTLAVLWPVLAANFRGLPPGAASIVTAVGLLVSYASYGIALVLLYRLATGGRSLRQPAPVGQPTGQPAGQLVGRGAFLAGAGGVALAAASGGLVRRVYADSALSYDGMVYTGPGVKHITPNDQFYVVTKNIVDPRPTKAAWRLRVDGTVDSPVTFDFADLEGVGSVEQEQTLECISNGINGGLMSNAVWRGVPLRRLIERAGPSPDAADVLLHAADGYTHDVSFEKAMEDTTLIAYEMNGEPLPQRHGYPARVLVPGYYGEGSVKWVTRVEIFERDVEDEYYGKQGWEAEHVTTWSRFDAARFDPPQPTGADQVKLRAGETTTLRGVAFAGDRGIDKVEVSTDGGGSWQEAGIDYSPSRLAWVFWSHGWRPEGSGRHELVVRATDGRGRLQQEKGEGGVANGKSGWSRLDAQVRA